eukprot:21037-Heterococcus_DN1.PRE.4
MLLLALEALADTVADIHSTVSITTAGSQFLPLVVSSGDTIDKSNVTHHAIVMLFNLVSYCTSQSLSCEKSRLAPPRITSTIHSAAGADHAYVTYTIAAALVQLLYVMEQVVVGVFDCSQLSCMSSIAGTPLRHKPRTL